MTVKDALINKGSIFIGNSSFKPATICQELRRNNGSGGSYRAETSQKSYVQRRRASISVGKWTPELAGIIEDKLQATWSPEQRHRQEGQLKTIYRWLFSGTKASVRIPLRHGGSMVWASRFSSIRKKYVHVSVWAGEPLTNPFQRNCRTWLDNPSLSLLINLLDFLKYDLR